MTNPYAPPASDVALAPLEDQLPLASRGKRFLAQCADGLLTVLLMIPLNQNVEIFQRAMTDRESLFSWEKCLWILTHYLVWAVFNGWFLRNGQTVGKKLFRIQVRRKDGTPVGWARYLLGRELPIRLSMLVPWVGAYLSLIDVLFIFREGRNTLHDDIAGSQVVQLPK